MLPFLLLSPLALSAETPAPARSVQLGAPASALSEHLWSSADARVDLLLPPDFPVSTDLSTTGQGPQVETRLRLGLAYERPRWSVGLEGDAFEFIAAGDPWDLDVPHANDRQTAGDLSTAFDLRRAALQARLGPILVDAGLMTSHWGLGLVANDGDHDPAFGKTEYGDRVMRLRLTTAPFGKGEVPLYLTLAGDAVVDDDTATWTDGQRAYQGVAAVLYRKPKGPEAGVYGVLRRQTETLDHDRTTQVGLLDLYTSLPFTLGPGTLRLAGEAAAMKGETTRSRTYNSREGLNLAAASAVTDLSYRVDDERYGLRLRGGWASGDGDPDDDTSHDFTMDRDYDVGMVLFDQLMDGLEAGAYLQLTDPTYAGAPPDGVDTLVNEGAARRLSYAQPILEARPIPLLRMQAGMVFAWSSGPVGQPFATYRNGGAPANAYGAPTEGYQLGSELDWGLILGGEPIERGPLDLRPSVQLQGGHLVPSANLVSGSEIERLSLYRLTARLQW